MELKNFKNGKFRKDCELQMNDKPVFLKNSYGMNKVINPLAKDTQNRNRLIIGSSGAGMSFLMNQLLEDNFVDQKTEYSRSSR